MAGDDSWLDGSTSSGESRKYETCPAGPKPGYLIGVIDLGTHENTYMGQEKPDVRKWLLAWELPGCKRQDGSSHVLVEQYNVYIDDAGKVVYPERSALKAMLESMTGQSFGKAEPLSIREYLGKPCCVNVSHRKNGDKAYHQIQSITSLMEGVIPPPATIEPVAIHINNREADTSWLPYVYGKSVASIIAESRERTGQKIKTKADMPKQPAANTPYSEPVPAGITTVPINMDDDDIPY